LGEPTLLTFASTSAKAISIVPWGVKNTDVSRKNTDVSRVVFHPLFSKATTFFNFSFQCGGEYHAPTDCDTIKRWLTKCADDSETANYISAHTKDVSSSPKNLFKADKK
jgi:hypothetical protein